MYEHIKRAFEQVGIMQVNESQEGEPLEIKIERMMNNKEPMNQPGVGVIYTERKDGVLPTYNIRTDRFEIAVEAANRS